MRHRLTVKFVEKIREDGHFADGGGLFLQVQSRADGSKAKSWVVRFRAPNGKMREMGLGIAEYVSLADARTRAHEARCKAANGIDPIEERNTLKAAARQAAIRPMTFKDCAEQYIESHRKTWRSEKHAAQWTATLTSYAYPVIGATPVAQVDQKFVLKVLDPIWASKTETANRVRQRMESVLDWAKVRGYREGDNPARWRGHLEKALPARSKVQRVAHHAALSYEDLPSFFLSLSETESSSARALAYCILTGTRTSETLLAKWSEIDDSGATWTIPGDRMKANREHRVPLSPAVQTILKRARKAASSTDVEYIFESPTREGAPLSNMALLMQLRRMGHDKITAHGFRSTFRDWAAEKTAYPREVAEAALAHTISDKVEAAYRRGDLFEKRRALMNDWAAYATSKLPSAPSIFVTATASAA